MKPRVSKGEGERSRQSGAAGCCTSPLYATVTNAQPCTQAGGHTFMMECAAHPEPRMTTTGLSDCTRSAPPAIGKGAQRSVEGLLADHLQVAAEGRHYSEG